MTKLIKLQKEVILSFLLVLILTLTACSEANFPKPETTVTSFFEALNKSDYESIKPLCLYSFSNFKFNDSNEEKFAKLLFSKIKGEIISSQVDGNSATVKVKITSIDMAKALETMMTKIISEATDAALNGKDLNDKQAEEMTMKYLEESINKADAPLVTKEYDIKLIKDKEKKAWVIDDNLDFAKALSGNIDELMSGGK